MYINPACVYVCTWQWLEVYALALSLEGKCIKTRHFDHIATAHPLLDENLFLFTVRKNAISSMESDVKNILEVIHNFWGSEI